MSNIQVKNVPPELHRKLRREAKRQGRRVRDLVLDAVRRELDRYAFVIRLRTRKRVNLGRSASRSLEEVRRERDRELGL